MIKEVLEKVIRDRQETEERHKKTTFWATDFEKDPFELFHRWIGTLPTDAYDAQTALTWDAGKRMEEAIVEMIPDEVVISKQARVEYVHPDFEFTVSGKPDLIVKGDQFNIPVEIKSYYGPSQEKDLKAYKPRRSYLKQLALYLLALDLPYGVLMYRDRGVGTIHEFGLYREGTAFSCGPIVFDLEDDFKQWGKLYEENIQRGIEPTPKYRYKTPIGQIGWKNVPTYKISQVRNGGLVLGDWQVKYSPYKNLYIEREGTCLGYSKEEMDYIKIVTDKYTTWNKKKKTEETVE